MALSGDNAARAARPSRRRLANAIRALAMDAVEAAQSGHPGMPMGMADIAEVLWNDYLRFDPAHPRWPDRDRFVLSNGHGSMLLYAVAYLTGYADRSGRDQALPATRLAHRGPSRARSRHRHRDDHRAARPGHRQRGRHGACRAHARGHVQSARGATIVDHHTYVFLGDGCMMEGISHEACSFAGTQRLGKLIAFYDDNGISIDGRPVKGGSRTTRRSASRRMVGTSCRGRRPRLRRRSAAPIDAARAAIDRPSLICCKTDHRFRCAARARHGRDARLGARRRRSRRGAQESWAGRPAAVRGSGRRQERLGRARARRAARAGVAEAASRPIAQQYPELAAEFERRMDGDLPGGWGEHARAPRSTRSPRRRPSRSRRARLRRPRSKR